MRNATAAPLEFQKTADNRWSVRLGSSKITVQTRKDAGLVAALPIVLEMLFSGSRETPNVPKARSVLATCKRYHLHTRIAEVRKLESGLSARGETHLLFTRPMQPLTADIVL